MLASYKVQYSLRTHAVCALNGQYYTTKYVRLRIRKRCAEDHRNSLDYISST